MKQGTNCRDDYIADDEMYVYDQSCENCCNLDCPLRYPVMAEEYMEVYGTLSDFDEDEAEQCYAEAEQRRKEDGVMHDGELVWCVNWQGKRSRKRMTDWQGGCDW